VFSFAPVKPPESPFCGANGKWGKLLAFSCPSLPCLVVVKLPGLYLNRLWSKDRNSWLLGLCFRRANPLNGRPGIRWICKQLMPSQRQVKRKVKISLIRQVDQVELTFCIPSVSVLAVNVHKRTILQGALQYNTHNWNK